jgi:hypothetical protein
LLKDPTKNFVKGNMTLTHQGIGDTYQRGVDIMSRYSQLLSQSMLKNVRVRASNTTRTVFSAYAQLVGMFGTQECKTSINNFAFHSPTKEISSLKDLNVDVSQWFAPYIPKVEVHQTGDPTFQINHRDWNLYNELTKKESRSEIIQQKFNELDKTMDQWSKKHYPEVNSEDNKYLCEYIGCAKSHLLEFDLIIFEEPHTEEKIFQTWREYNSLNLKDVWYQNSMVWQLYASKLMKDIIRALDQAVKDNDKTKNSDNYSRILYYYDSWHDTNILALIAVLGIEYNDIIDFSSSLFFELHQDDLNEELFVKVFLDDEELDIILTDKLEKHLLNVKGRSIHPQHSSLVPMIDQIDRNSSSYNYLKRYLLRRVLSEEVDTYCDKRIEDLEYIEKSTCRVQKQTSPEFVIAMIVSAFLLLLIAAIATAWWLKSRKDEKLIKLRVDTPSNDVMNKHFKFQDEEEVVEGRTSDITI